MKQRTLFTLATCTVLALFIGLLPNPVSAQDAPAYIQFETIYLKPDTKNLATLTTNMKAHNDTYHSAMPYHANVWQVANGPKAGWIVWAMGPCTFSDMDNRPAANGHDEDWANNVMPNITDMGTIEYWRLDQEVSLPPPDEPLPNFYIRFYRVNDDMAFLMADLWKKISETRKAMPEKRSWALFNNMFQQGDIGRHFASVTPFGSWSELDNGMDLDPSSPGSFRTTFIELYGESAWTPFSNSMGEAFEDSYTEIWTRMPDMSAPPVENE